MEPATPRFETRLLRLLNHGDRCFVAFKTLSESYHMNNTLQYILKLSNLLLFCVFMQSFVNSNE